MKEVIYSLSILAVLFFIYWIYGFVKALKDPDVQEASKLHMSVKRYRIYKEIFEEQTKCYDEGLPVPNRMNDIPNMNEWRRYGEYQIQKQSESMFKELDSIKKG